MSLLNDCLDLKYVKIFIFPDFIRQILQCSNQGRVGDVPDQEVSGWEEWLEDHDREWEHEPQSQQRNHWDDHWQDKVGALPSKQSYFFPMSNV